jgi:hypothetical protein
VVTATDQLKALAFIGMLARLEPGRNGRDYFLGNEFRSGYEADWYWPDTAIGLIGAQWLVKEMIDQGMVDASDLPDMPAARSPVIAWTVRGAKSTEAFSVNASVWLIRWQMVQASANRFVTVTVYREGTNEIVTSMFGSDDGVSYVRTRPGRFYLEVTTVACAADITVEQPESDR